MKIFHFQMPSGDGYVDMKVDILGGNKGVNATIMEIKIRSTLSDDAFLRKYTYFAGIQQLVSSEGILRKLATDHNLTLKIFDQDSTVNANASTTTTTTTTAPTTTTTTTTP